MEIYKAHTKAQLTIYGGFLLHNDDIKSFLTQEKVRSKKMTANDMHSWLAEEQELPIYLYPGHCVDPNAQESDVDPRTSLFYFAQTTVKYADLEFTDAGIIPTTLPAITPDQKKRVEQWLKLDSASASQYDAHVTDLARRIFFVESEPVDEQMEAMFHWIGKITNKNPRDVEFTMVYDRDEMTRIMEHYKDTQELFQQYAADKSPTQSG